MNTARNQLHRETEGKLRAALLFFMEQEKEPTVGQLCEKAGINRSTFYRHYMDVAELMEKTEEEIQQGLFGHIYGIADEDGLRMSEKLMETIVTYMGENRHFYKTFLRSHSGPLAGARWQKFWDSMLVPRFRYHGVRNEAHMRYFFEYTKAGFTRVLVCWLDQGCPESPKELAEVLYKMLPAVE